MSHFMGMGFSGFLILAVSCYLKVSRQRLKFVMRRPELKIPTLAKWLSISTCDNQNL